MNIFRFIIKSLVNTTVIGLYFYDQDQTHKVELKDNDSILVQLWLYFNVLSIAIEPLYFVVFIPFLHPEGSNSEKADSSSDNF